MTNSNRTSLQQQTPVTHRSSIPLPHVDTTKKHALTVLVLWPHPRKSKVEQSLQNPDLHEEADGFSYLPDCGYDFEMLESTPYPWNPLAKRGSLFAGIDPLRLVRLLLSYRRWDVLVSMDSSSCFLFVQLKRLLRLKKPVVVIDPALTATYRRRKAMHDAVLPYVERVAVFGKVQLDFLRQEYGNKVRAKFIHHRMDTRFFDPESVDREPVSSGREKDFFLSVGDDVGRDFGTLLQAFQGLDQKLVVRSSHVTEPTLPNMTAMRERLNFPQLRRLYANSAAVILPLHDTIHASGINTLLEAMAMGKPVIVSGSKGIIDYVEHGRTAWVVPPNDPAALRAAVIKLSGDAQLRKQLGSGARKFCEEVCSMPLYMKKVSELVGQSLSETRSASL